MIERFTKEQFESALPTHKITGKALWTYHGFFDGEHEYLIPIDEKVSILVRSTVKYSGINAEAGQDSIRIWLVKSKNRSPLGSKVGKWITRQAGWQERMTKAMRELWIWRKTAGDDDKGQPHEIFRAKKGANRGKMFIKNSNGDFIRWL